jgi:hypothetical protein
MVVVLTLELDEHEHGRATTRTLPHCVAKAGVCRSSAGAVEARAVGA